MALWFEKMGDIFSYMLVPIIVGILICICASILGVMLVLKRYSMIGDGLSHVGFGAFSIAFALELGNAPMLVAMPIVIVAAYILLVSGQGKRIKGDAAIALISSSALAIGYLVGNMRDGFAADIKSYMFGSITTATTTELWYIAPITIIITVCFILMYNKTFVTTFDESFAKAIGINTGMYNTFLAIAVAIIVVIGMRIMGTLLISSIIIFPALTSMRLFNNFKLVIASSAIISVLAFLIAFLCFTSFSSAASIVVVNLVFFIVACIISGFKKHFLKN